MTTINELNNNHEPTKEEMPTSMLKMNYFCLIEMSIKTRKMAERIEEELIRRGEGKIPRKEAKKIAAVFRDPDHTMEDIEKVFLPEVQA